MHEVITEIRRLCGDVPDSVADLIQNELDKIEPALVFRLGIVTAIQVAVDDIGALVQRRQRAQARDDVTGAIIAAARRIAALPMPTTPEDAPFTRQSAVIDFADLQPIQIESAARALLDAEEQIRQTILSLMPEDAHTTFSTINPPLPRWEELDEVMRDRFRMRARRCLTAAILP